MTFWLRVALLLLAASGEAATLAIQGNTLTATSANLQVTFTNADITAITNLLTGEQYIRNPSTNSQTDLVLLQPTNQQLTPGSWNLNSAGTSAALSLSDSTRSMTITVSIDSATQQIAVDLDGKAAQGGVEYLQWGATGFDMTTGSFVVPGQEGGVWVNAKSFGAASSYFFGGDEWEVPLSLFQTTRGGVAIFSNDVKSLFKDLALSAGVQQTANQQVQVEAPAPWSQATEAGPVEWRLAAYAGEWQAGARIYRDWHNANFPPAPLNPGRSWVNNIRTVVQVYDNPYNTSTLDALASVLVPAQTLLYLSSWRSQGYDVGYPDYSWIPSAPAYIAYAHKLGFHVMLHANSMGVSPASSDYAAIAQYQIRDPYTLQPVGWLWNDPPSTPNRFAAINPAAAAYRQLFLARITPAVQMLQPDAIHLDAGACVNDANGLIQGMNCFQGLAQLHRDLLAAFPNLVIGGEQTGDTFGPFQNFSQQHSWNPPGQDPNVTPPVPISAYVLNNVHRYVHLGALNPNDGGFIWDIQLMEGEAVLPTLHTPVPSSSQVDMARYLGTIRAFEQYALTPAWDTPWNGAEMVYQGSNGATAALTDDGTILQFTLRQGASSSVLYQRVHNVNQIDSPNSVPNWPAFNGSVTLGLDPSVQYWLDPTAKNTSLPHITSLPSGARIALGTGTLVTPKFSYFTLLPPASTSFNFFSNLWTASLGITYQGQDYQLGDGATVNNGSLTVGGVSSPAITAFPPWMTKPGGDTFIEYSVPLPSGAPTLYFAAAMDDSDTGRHQGPMTFKVEINGVIFWQQDLTTGSWQPGSIDLSAWSGQTVKIRFVENPGPGGPYAAFGGWSNLQISTAAPSTFDSIILNANASAAVTGGSANVGNGTITVNNLPFNGTIVLFSGTANAAGMGQTLFNLPFSISQGSNTQLATIPNPPPLNAGNLGPQSSGGVTKQQTLFAPSPAIGQTIFSWLLQLPTTPLAFSFSAGFWDNVHPPFPQGYLMSVRVNGTTLWQRVVNIPPSWQPGAVDLSRWAGQTILLELITDSQGANSNNFTSWADLFFTATNNASCVASVSSLNQITASASGATGTIAVSASSGCDWISRSSASWITATPSSSSGNGTVFYSISANNGPARQSTLEIAGYVIAVSQSAAVPFTGPELTSAVTVANGSQVVAPNTWMVLGGQNLSATTRSWLAPDFVNGEMPVQLDAVTVSVGGKPAIVEYIDAKQVNILTPIDIPVQGVVQVTVTSGGITSAPVYLQAQPAIPEFFLFANSRYVAAEHADGSYLGPTTLFPGATTPAKPGEVVTLFASGFGQTNPPITGLSANQYASLPQQPVFTIGGIPALIQFAGVVSPGLYQFNVVVPATLPNGDNAIVATYQGLSTQPGVVITVQQ